MKTNIESVLPNHTLITSNSNNIYIIDFKHINGGNVELLEIEPEKIKYVHLKNTQPTPIIFDGFKNNALPLDIGLFNKQCECVIFPESCDDKDWILFIETKYVNSLENAFRENNDYPNCMVTQIIETVKYFREKEIIQNNRRVNAIVSFPPLIEEFNSTFFTGIQTVDEILRDYNILIRATNSAIIKSEKRITLIV